MSRTRRTRSRKRPTSEARDHVRSSAPPRLMSRDEKRELILAHAAARRPLKPRDRITLWGGVLICALFILGAWATTVQSGINRLSASSPEDELGEIIDASREITKELTNATEQGTNGLQTEFEKIQKEAERNSNKKEIRDALRLQLAAGKQAVATSSSPEAEAVTSTHATSTEATIE